MSRAELADAVKALGPEGGPVTSPAGRCCVSAGSDPLDALHGALTR